MKLKTDASGNAVLQDGKPVYVSDDGAELALDAADLYGQVKRLTGENRDHRKAKQDAETKLAQYADIDDPKAAREALETVKSLEGKTKADVERYGRKSRNRMRRSSQKCRPRCRRRKPPCIAN